MDPALVDLQETHLARREREIGCPQRRDLAAGGRGNDVLYAGSLATVDADLDDAAVPGRPEGGDLLSGGDGDDEIYGDAENNLIEGAQGWGLNVNGSSNLFQGIRAASNNRLIGNIVAGTELGAKTSSRFPADARGTADNVWSHDLWIGVDGSFGLRNMATIRTLIDRFAFLNGAAGGRGSETVEGVNNPNSERSCGVLSEDCSVTYRDGILFNNASGGLRVTASADDVQFCTITNVSSNNPTSNYADLASTCAGAGGDQCLCSGTNTTAPDLYGNGTNGASRCATYCPNGDVACDGTGTSGGDRGPDIRCKTVNGTTLTGSANALWVPSGTGGAIIRSDSTTSTFPTVTLS